MRVWGYNDRNATTVAGGLPQYGDNGNVVFQTFANGKATIDVSGFDQVVDGATKSGIKLLVTLTNNWADYGGMDVYTTNLGGRYHDDVRSLTTCYFSCGLTVHLVLPSSRYQGTIQGLC